MDHDPPDGSSDSAFRRDEVLRLALSVARAGVWELDVAANRVRWTDADGQLPDWKATPHEGGFDELLKLVHADDHATVRASLAAVFSDARRTGAYEVEARFANPGEEMRWFHVKGRLFRDDTGLPTRMIGMVSDITARKQADLALQTSEARLRKSQALAHLGTYEVSAVQGGPEYWSDEAFRILGRDPADAALPLGRLMSEVVAPEDYERIAEVVRAAIEDGRPWDYQFTLLRPDGSTRRIRSIGEPVRDPVLGTTQLVGTILDITELSQLEEQVMQLQKLEAVGRLAGGIAHDFNNLLTVIATYCDLALARIQVEDPVHEMIRAIRGSGRRAAMLTRQLLAFSRRTVVSPVVLDLNELLLDREELLRRVVEEDVELTLQLDADPCPVCADPTQLEQVLLNLALNARDAMPAGGRLHISTRNLAGLPRAAGPQVLLMVEDTGIGMHEVTRARVFEPFFTTKEVGRGSGLGLPVLFGIVQQSGGYVELESEPGRGAAFRIFLPRSDAPLASRPGDPGAQPIQTGSGTVLVVAHEERVRSLACAALESAGYRVLRADGGQSALFLSESLRDRIDLLVTNVALPASAGLDIGGLELAGHLRAKRPDLKVLFVSALADNVLLRKGIRRTDGHFLSQPFTAAALTRKVRDVLEGVATA